MNSISIKIKKKCCELSEEGKTYREIYDEYFKHEFEEPQSFESFRVSIKRWKKQTFPDDTTLVCGTYEGFTANNATVQVSKSGEIVQAWIKQKADDFDINDFLVAIKSVVKPIDHETIVKEDCNRMLRRIQENGYTTITVRELAQYLNGQGEMPEKPVILTIDDGKLGVYKNALPLLRKYNMKAVLAVIGTEIHAASEAPELRSDNPAPYCTWAELAEMSDSGHVEIASHSYGFHVYQHNGRIGADCGTPDTMTEFRMDAYKDFRTLQECLKNYDIPAAVTFAYPYSKRSVPADEVWLQCGYQILLGGNMESARASRTNYFIQEAGLNAHSSVLRRVARMHGTPSEDYIG